MRGFRKRQQQDREPLPVNDGHDNDDDVLTNPWRGADLYYRTVEGYIIAHDISSQNEYVEQTPCPHCGGPLMVIAVLNRAGQGLSELVAVCRTCRTRSSFVFDISNDVYQDWWAAQLGDLYIQQYDGTPRTPEYDQD